MINKPEIRGTIMTVFSAFLDTFQGPELKQLWAAFQKGMSLFANYKKKLEIQPSSVSAFQKVLTRFCSSNGLASAGD